MIPIGNHSEMNFLWDCHIAFSFFAINGQSHKEFTVEWFFYTKLKFNDWLLYLSDVTSFNHYFRIESYSTVKNVRLPHKCAEASEM